MREITSFYYLIKMWSVNVLHVRNRAYSRHIGITLSSDIIYFTMNLLRCTLNFCSSDSIHVSNELGSNVHNVSITAGSITYTNICVKPIRYASIGNNRLWKVIISVKLIISNSPSINSPVQNNRYLCSNTSEVNSSKTV